MSDPERTTRGYHSARREAQARRTRFLVLQAARVVFLDGGFVGATLKAIATEADVSVPTVEALFGTKARVLKAAIDVAIAGDEEPVPVLDRDWTIAALGAESVDALLWIVAGVIAPAQARSAGLVLAVFEGAPTDPELAELAERLITQRSKTAEWLVDAIAAKTPLADGLSKREAIDTLWMLMDPAVFDRVTRHRHWTEQQYQQWFVRSAARLLTANTP